MYGFDLDGITDRNSFLQRSLQANQTSIKPHHVPMFTRQSDVRKRGHVVPMFTRQSDVRKRDHVVPMFTRQSDVGKRGRIVPMFTGQSDSIRKN